jgi:hypothetical protein
MICVRHSFILESSLSKISLLRGSPCSRLAYSINTLRLLNIYFSISSMRTRLLSSYYSEPSGWESSSSIALPSIYEKKSTSSVFLS